MKRTFSLTAMCALLWAGLSPQWLPAQGFFDNFETGTLDAGYTLINGDSLTPALEDDAAWADTAWIVTTSSAFTGFAALSISWYSDAGGNDVGPANDWLILPKLTLDANAVLKFDAKSATSSGDFPDDYWVLINAGEPTQQDFEDNGAILLQVDDEAHSDFTTRVIDLGAYAGQEVYLAFRNVTNLDGYGLWLDNIFVGDTTTTSLDVGQHFFGLQLRPNPAAGHSLLHYQLDRPAEVSITIRDFQGREVAHLPRQAQAQGPQVAPLPIGQLSPGVYLVSLRAGARQSSTRLVIH